MSNTTLDFLVSKVTGARGHHSLSRVHPVFSNLRYLLLLRFAVVNLVGIGLTGVAWQQGWIDQALAADPTRIVVAITIVFLAGLAIASVKVWNTSMELNEVRRRYPTADSKTGKYLAHIRDRDATSRSTLAAALKLKLAQRIRMVRHLADSLVVMGLIGTVIGFIMALSGVDPAVAADPQAIGPMVSHLIDGMAVALYTTLVGAILNVWLGVCHQVLATGTVNLISEIVTRGEDEAAGRLETA